MLVILTATHILPPPPWSARWSLKKKAVHLVIGAPPETV